MTIYSLLFYSLSALILVCTGMAVTRPNLVHAVIYLVFSFFGSALLFYLMGAPLLAALEVIIYAGAIMILFLFIIMMIRAAGAEAKTFPLAQWLPAAGVSLLCAGVLLMLVVLGREGDAPLRLSMAAPADFGAFVFDRHWLSIEIVSLLLLIALMGVIRLGKDAGRPPEDGRSPS